MLIDTRGRKRGRRRRVIYKVDEENEREAGSGSNVPLGGTGTLHTTLFAC